MYLAMLELSYLDHRIIFVNSIALMEGSKEEWYFLKEENSLKFMEYLSNVINRVSSHQLGAIKEYTCWIKAGSYYHLSILRREELNFYPHLRHVCPPSPNVQCPSVATLNTHERDFSRARNDPCLLINEFQKVWDRLMEVLKLHQNTKRATSIASIKKPDMQSSASSRSSAQASSTQASSTQSGTTLMPSSSSNHSVTQGHRGPTQASELLHLSRLRRHQGHGHLGA